MSMKVLKLNVQGKKWTKEVEKQISGIFKIIEENGTEIIILTKVNDEQLEIISKSIKKNMTGIRVMLKTNIM